MPPLRRRKEDIPFLVEHFLKKFSSREKKPVRRIDKKAMNALMKYAFPGNVRELENIVERAVILGRHEEISEEDLPAFSTGEETLQDIAAAGIPLPEKIREFERKIILAALERNRFVGTKTARELGISESTLRYKMESLGIRPG